MGEHDSERGLRTRLGNDYALGRRRKRIQERRPLGLGPDALDVLWSWKMRRVVIC